MTSLKQKNREIYQDCKSEIYSIQCAKEYSLLITTRKLVLYYRLKDQIKPKQGEKKLCSEVDKYMLDKRGIRKGMEKHKETQDKVSQFGEQRLQRRKT